MTKSGVKWFVILLVFSSIAVLLFHAGAEDKASPENKTTLIRVASLNTGENVLIGRLGHPLGTYHVVRATFGMPTSKGYAGNGGRLYLHVVEVDGHMLHEPQWIPYFKSMTLQEYLLPDGTNMFPVHPNTDILNGKTVVCKVCETLHLLDLSGDVSEHYGNTQKRGFDEPYYETSLGILYVLSKNPAP